MGLIQVIKYIVELALTDLRMISCSADGLVLAEDGQLVQ